MKPRYFGLCRFFHRWGDSHRYQEIGGKVWVIWDCSRCPAMLLTQGPGEVELIDWGRPLPRTEEK